MSWLWDVCISNADIPDLLSIVLQAIVALAKVAWLIFSPSGASFLSSASRSWQARSTTALKFLFSWSFSWMLMWRSLSCLSFLAAEMKPGAQSVIIVIGPGYRIGVVSEMSPDFKSSSFSDGISVEDIIDVK